SEPADVKLLGFFYAEDAEDRNNAVEGDGHGCSFLSSGGCRVLLCRAARLGNAGSTLHCETTAGYGTALAQGLGIEICPSPDFAIVADPSAYQFADKESFVAALQFVDLLERLGRQLKFI